MIILSGYDNFEYVKQTLMQGVVDYILKPTLTPHELLGVLQKRQRGFPAGIRIMQWPGKPRRNCSKNCCSGKQKQEKNCKRYLPHHITACMRLRLRMGVNGRQKQQNFYAKNTACQKWIFRSTHLFSSDGHPLPCSVEKFCKRNCGGCQRIRRHARYRGFSGFQWNRKPTVFAFRRNIRYGSSK